MQENIGSLAGIWVGGGSGKLWWELAFAGNPHTLHPYWYRKAGTKYWFWVRVWLGATCESSTEIYRWEEVHC